MSSVLDKSRTAVELSLPHQPDRKPIGHTETESMFCNQLVLLWCSQLISRAVVKERLCTEDIGHHQCRRVSLGIAAELFPQLKVRSYVPWTNVVQVEQRGSTATLKPVHAYTSGRSETNNPSGNAGLDGRSNPMRNHPPYGRFDAIDDMCHERFIDEDHDEECLRYQDGPCTCGSEI